MRLEVHTMMGMVCPGGKRGSGDLGSGVRPLMDTVPCEQRCDSLLGGEVITERQGQES